MSTAPGQPTPAIYPDLKGKVVLLTGIGQVGSDSSRWGNGAATAYAFAQQGSKIFGCDLSIESARTTQRRIQSLIATAVDIEVAAADATDDAQVKATVDACLRRFGRVDVLINNVGMSMPGGPAEMDERTWDAQMAVNLKSVYLFCHHVLPIMERQKGGDAVVNVASIAGLLYIGKPQIGYSAAKAGVIQFTKATALMYATKGVRMNVVVPGLIHTPLVEVLADKYNKGDYQGLVDKRSASVPMGWQGEGIDVANAILFLASAQSRYITGQKIVVDGGITSCTAPG